MGLHEATFASPEQGIVLTVWGKINDPLRVFPDAFATIPVIRCTFACLLI
jgi:hypothetical protein